MALSADTVGEILRWLDDREDRRWMLLRLTTRYHLRCPPTHQAPPKLFDRGEDAFACVHYCGGDYIALATLALGADHGAAYRRRLMTPIPREGLQATFTWACENNRLSVAKCMEEMGGLAGINDTDDLIFGAWTSACHNGHLKVAKWIASRFCVGNDWIAWVFRRTCRNGHLEVAKWLAERSAAVGTRLRGLADRTFGETCENGHLEVAKWLAKHFELAPAAIRSEIHVMIRKANMFGQLQLAKWLVDFQRSA